MRIAASLPSEDWCRAEGCPLPSTSAGGSGAQLEGERQGDDDNEAVLE